MTIKNSEIYIDQTIYLLCRFLFVLAYIIQIKVNKGGKKTQAISHEIKICMYFFVKDLTDLLNTTDCFHFIHNMSPAVPEILWGCNAYDTPINIYLLLLFLEEKIRRDLYFFDGLCDILKFIVQWSLGHLRLSYSGFAPCCQTLFNVNVIKLVVDLLSYRY